MSTPSISTTYPAITEESSTSFNASSSMQVTMKTSPASSKLAWGYRELKIPRVRHADYLILARMMS
jgi:hypothetical protein